MKYLKEIAFALVLTGVAIAPFASVLTGDREAKSWALEEVAYYPGGSNMRDICLEGVLYAGSGSKPQTPIYEGDGSVQSCSMDIRSLDTIGKSYRPVCRNGVRYIRFPDIHDPAIFVKIDADTLLPESCSD